MARISDRSLRTPRTSDRDLRDIVTKRNKRLNEPTHKSRVPANALHGQLGTASPQLQAAVARVEKYLNNMSKPYRRGS